MVVQLDKALYGCVESAKLWYDHLRKTLESLGFTVNPHDICVFNKGDVKDGTQCTIALHVNDLTITCKNKAIIDIVVADIIGVYKTWQCAEEQCTHIWEFLKGREGVSVH